MRSERNIEHSFQRLVPLFFCLMNDLYSELEQYQKTRLLLIDADLYPTRKTETFFLIT
jgi:hypothetical protein